MKNLLITNDLKGLRPQEVMCDSEYLEIYDCNCNIIHRNDIHRNDKML